MVSTSTVYASGTHSKAWVYGCLLAGTAGSNPAGVSVSRACYLLSSKDLCDGPVTRPEESYRVWCV